MPALAIVPTEPIVDRLEPAAVPKVPIVPAVPAVLVPILAAFMYSKLFLSTVLTSEIAIHLLFKYKVYVVTLNLIYKLNTKKTQTKVWVF